MRINKWKLQLIVMAVVIWSNNSFARYLQSDPIGIMRDYSLLNNPNNIYPPTPSLHRSLNHPYSYTEQNPINYIDANGLDSIRISLMQAIARGDTRQIRTLMDLLTDPKLQKAAREALNKFGSKEDDWIQQQCKGKIRQKFPDEYLDKTLEQIRKDKSKNAKTAWKLLNDSRFKK